MSWLLTRGVHRCDVAVLYPVAPLDAGLSTSPEVAFGVMRHLVTAGCDADFIDDASLARATVDQGFLHAADERFRVLILADLPAIRHASLLQAQAFAQRGGLVLALGRLPRASERSGDGDAEVVRIVGALFGAVGEVREHPGGGASALVADAAAALALIDQRIPRDCVPEAPAYVLHRHADDLDGWFLVGAGPGSLLTVRGVGPVEVWDPWTGTTAPLSSAHSDGTVTRIRLPATATPHDAWIVVVRPGAPAQGSLEPPAQPVTPPPLTLEGSWESALEPTMDNTWGDFRLPITESMIGAEVRRVRLAPGTLADDVWVQPGVDDRTWPEATCGFGPQAWRLDVPEGIAPEAIVAALVQVDAIDPARPWPVDGRELAWKPQEFSWRWGAEGDPGPQGFHGLKGVISDEVLAIGDPLPPPIRYSWESLRTPGAYPTRVLWTTITVPSALAEADDQTSAHHQAAPGGPVTSTTATAEVLVGGLQPAGIWLDGQPIRAGMRLKVRDGARLLVRYDGAGHGHVVLRRIWAPAPRRELATRWWCDTAVLPWAAEPQGGVLRAHCVAPPGLTGLTLTVRAARTGDVAVWVDGRSVALRENGQREDGSLTLGADWETPVPAASVLAVRVKTPPGTSGAGVLTEPIRLRTGAGRIDQGDWSQLGVLADYSGAIRYRRSIELDAERLRKRTWLDLGRVAATAAVHLNGERVGVLLSAPWRIEITRHLRPGANRLEIQVCNTLANHYRTLPTRYPGDLVSGLIGPVRMVHQG